MYLMLVGFRHSWNRTRLTFGMSFRSFVAGGMRDTDLSDLAQSLDYHKSNDTARGGPKGLNFLSPMQRKLIGDRLEKEDAKEDHPMLRGILDSEGETLCEILNEALIKKDTFRSLLKVPKPPLFCNFAPI